MVRDNHQSWGHTVKRSRRVVLTMMGTAAVGAVSMGLVQRRGCGPGRVGELVREPDGRLRESCPVTYGGFGGAPHRLHGQFHARGGG